MPEGPEVCIMKDNLGYFEGSKLTEMIILSDKYDKLFHTNYNYLCSQLPLKINKINVKGKLLYITLQNDLYLCFRPMLSGYIGRLTDNIETNYYEGFKFNPNLNRVEFITSNGSFFINDTRNFHILSIYRNKSEIQNELNKLGIDLLSELPNISVSEFIDYVKKYPNKCICDFLIEQDKIAGIGNYLRAEIMYSAKVYPLTKIKNLTDVQIKHIYEWAIKISNKVYTLAKDYRFKVYEKADYIVKSGRKIWYDKNTQLP